MSVVFMMGSDFGRTRINSPEEMGGPLVVTSMMLMGQGSEVAEHLAKPGSMIVDEVFRFHDRPRYPSAYI